MSYLGRSAKLSLKAQEKVSFLATAGQTVKTGLSYTPSFIEVYVNGVLLTDTTDFTATNGNSITFTVALLLNDEVTVISLKTFTVADHLPKSGGTMTGDTAHGDNVKSKFGNSDDLQIYHDGSASRIVDSGTGGLALQADANVVIQNSAGTETKAEFTTDGGVNLYHDNAAKFSTTATGVETQGRVMLSGADNHLRFNGNSSTPLGECIHRPAAANIAIVTGSAERMRIDSAGIVTKPYQPAFLATKTSTSSNAAINTDHTVLFPTEVYDQNSDFSSNTFTAPVTGKYLLTASLRLDQVDEAANYYLLGIIGSNRSFREIWNPGGITDNDSYHTLQVSGLLDMDANDTAIVRFNQNAGNPQVDQDGNAEMSYFCGHLVC